MNKDKGKNAGADSDDVIESAAAALIAGERLGEARREKKIKVSEVAQELHIDEPKVRALESNEFDIIGPAVFVKGHLRKYAQLVGVDQADVMADYYNLTRSEGAPPVVSASRRRRNKSFALPLLIVVLLLGAAGAAYWWFSLRMQPSPVTTPPPESVGEPAIEQGADEPTAAIEQVAQPVSLDVDNASDDVVGAPVLDPVSIVEEEPVSSDTMLTISFSGDCWSEITDAAGRRLFFDLGKAGRVVEISGEAPFNVLFGNVQNVSISVDGASFQIPPESRDGRTARLTINGS